MDYITGILSDQSQWLDDLDKQYDFFKEFDVIFNSYHMGKGKKDPALFDEISIKLGIKSSEILFIDDNEGNIERARAKGWNTILYRNKEDFLQEMSGIRIFITVKSLSMGAWEPLFCPAQDAGFPWISA